MDVAPANSINAGTWAFGTPRVRTYIFKVCKLDARTPPPAVGTSKTSAAAAVTRIFT
jgi:hypothetical protein